jgi:hypothetical protein
LMALGNSKRKLFSRRQRFSLADTGFPNNLRSQSYRSAAYVLHLSLVEKYSIATARFIL